MSGVLAVVVAGLYSNWNSSEIFSQRSRMQATSSWRTVIFILNGIIFILIGLQLPEIMKNILAEHPPVYTREVRLDRKSRRNPRSYNLGISGQHTCPAGSAKNTVTRALSAAQHSQR